jgi:hypothetical protein
VSDASDLAPIIDVNKPSRAVLAGRRQYSAIRTEGALRDLPVQLECNFSPTYQLLESNDPLFTP